MGWIISGGVLLFLVFLLSLRLSFRIFAAAETKVYLLYGPVRFRLYPGKNKKDKQTTEKQQEKEKAKRAKKEKKQEKEEKGAPKKIFENISLILDLLKTLPKPLNWIFRGVHIHVQHAYISVSASDAAQTAILYGRTCAGVYGLLALLQNRFTIRVRPADLYIAPNYLQEKTRWDIAASISIRAGTLLGAALLLGFRCLKVLIRRSDTQKEDQNNNPINERKQHRKTQRPAA
ncbi:MAG TPA: DUF2953 domain-containing protein [Firmicutes bacterium]|nr:DUF2953 domain-containing protein [Bacillota bacterium]